MAGKTGGIQTECIDVDRTRGQGLGRVAMKEGALFLDPWPKGFQVLDGADFIVGKDDADQAAPRPRC